MSCAHLKKIVNKNYERYGGKKYWYVPCGHCINCMRAKVSGLEREANYEWKHHIYNSFVTLTYDEESIINNIVKDEKGDIYYTLKKKDYQDFMKRLRWYIKDFKLGEDKGVEKDWKYMVTGEYGDKFGRCHFHILFFGLDFMAMQKIYELAWGKGIVQSLPLKAGAIRYVLKYMSKSLNSKNFMSEYDKKGIERPFNYHSVGLGKGLYQEQEEHIIKYGTLNYYGEEVPLRRYYADRLKAKRLETDTKTLKEMEELGIKTEHTEQDKITEYKINKALTQEENAVIKERANGVPTEDIDYSNINAWKY